MDNLKGFAVFVTIQLLASDQCCFWLVSCQCCCWWCKCCGW